VGCEGVQHRPERGVSLKANRQGQSRRVHFFLFYLNLS
jgi:hypothetical protein